VSIRDPVASRARVTCDMCGGARKRSERHRLVWDAGDDTELILAELCPICAERPGRVLEFYGSRRHDALRVIHVHAAREGQRQGHTTRGIIVRGLVYILVALAAFVVVTSVTSR
jgi:hypothetical protein